MNIIFFGSSQFAQPPLRRLKESGENVLCVVTQPDKKKGRGLHLGYTALKETALGLGMNVYQPGNLNTKETEDYLKMFNPDLLVVAAYGKILPAKLLEIPRILSVNLHASLLPKYRGAAPINWAIINGEKETGVTVIKMNARMDEGEMILQENVAIDYKDTNITLQDKLSHLGADALAKALNSIKEGVYTLTAQDGAQASYAPLLKRVDGKINWDLPAGHIYNLIRGCTAWPGAFTLYKNKVIKVWEADIDYDMQSDASPGTIIKAADDCIAVKTGEGNIIIRQLQSESGRRMSAGDFLHGHKIQAEDRLT